MNNFRLADGLIYEKPFANWEDSLLLEGAVPYTNLLWLEANRKIMLSDRPLCKVLDYENKKRSIMGISDQYGKSRHCNGIFNGFYGTQKNSRQKNNLNGLRQAFKIHRCGIPNRLKKLESDKEFYPLRIIGQSEYHNGWYWSWVGLLWCAALCKKDFIIEARRVFMMFRAKYGRYGTIHEVYDRFGIPC